MSNLDHSITASIFRERRRNNRQTDSMVFISFKRGGWRKLVQRNGTTRKLSEKAAPFRNVKAASF